MDMPSNLVEIQQVSKSYGSLVALNNINLRLGTGKIIGLLRPQVQSLEPNSTMVSITR